MRLIDANDVYKYALQQLRDERFTDEEYDAVIQAVDDTDTVYDVEAVVHAKWQHVQNGKGLCSNCNRLDRIDNLATHCRYCGAKIEKGVK